MRIADITLPVFTAGLGWRILSAVYGVADGGKRKPRLILAMPGFIAVVAAILRYYRVIKAGLVDPTKIIRYLPARSLRRRNSR